MATRKFKSDSFNDPVADNIRGIFLAVQPSDPGDPGDPGDPDADPPVPARAARAATPTRVKAVALTYRLDKEGGGQLPQDGVTIPASVYGKVTELQAILDEAAPQLSAHLEKISDVA